MQPMHRSSHYRQLALYSLTLLTGAYLLIIGGTFTGIVNLSLSRFSLALISGGVVIWAVFTLFIAPQRSGYWSVLGLALLLWLAAYGVSTLNTLTSRTLMGTWYAGFYVGFWLILTDLRRRGLPAHWIADTVLFASVPLMLLAVVQVWAWFPAWWRLRDLPVAFVTPRPSATLGNANALGTLMAASLPMVWARNRFSPRRLHRVVWRAWIGLAFITLFLTTSRGAWLGAAFGMGLFWALLKYRGWMAELRAHQIRFRPRPGAVFVMVAVLAVMIVGLVIAVQAFQTPRRDLGPRLGFFRTALETWRDHPLTGSGPFTFGLRLQEDISVPPLQAHSHAHNLVLNIAAELGLPGLIALVVTVGMAVYHARRRLLERHTPAEFGEQAGYCSALAVVGVHSLADMTIMMPALMLFALALLNMAVDPGQQELSGHRSPRAELCHLTYGGTVIALWSSLLISGWWSLGVYETYTRGELALLDGDFAAGVDLLGEVSHEQPNVALYWAEYGYAAGLAAHAGDERWLEQGISAYDHALRLEPCHAAWWANRAALLWQSDASVQAIESMRQATQRAPEYQDFWLNLGMYYEAVGMFDEAYTAYIHVLDLRQGWGWAEFWDATDFRRSVVASFPLMPTPYARAQALAETGDWNEAVKLLMTEISRDPAQPLPYVYVARLYSEDGLPDQAVKYLDAARLLVHTDPDAAWIAYIDALMAQAAGNRVAEQDFLTQARDLLGPDETGYSVLYGLEVAQYQFLRAKIPFLLLPQLTVLGPYPDLRDLLRSSF